MAFLKKYIFVWGVGLLILSNPVWAIEGGQLYSIAHFGAKFKDSDEYFQANGSLGFALTEDWGIAARAYYREGSDSTRAEFSALFLGGEWRWFFEPTEFAIAVGNVQIKLPDQDEKESLLTLMGEAAYEWALTEALAFRFDFNVEFPLESNQENSFYLGFGFRYVL